MTRNNIKNKGGIAMGMKLTWPKWLLINTMITMKFNDIGINVIPTIFEDTNLNKNTYLNTKASLTSSCQEAFLYVLACSSMSLT